MIYVSYNDKLSAKYAWNAGVRLGYTALNTPLLTTLFFSFFYHIGITNNCLFIRYSKTLQNVSLKASINWI
jgi:hypothetical protein